MKKKIMHNKLKTTYVFAHVLNHVVGEVFVLNRN